MADFENRLVKSIVLRAFGGYEQIEIKDWPLNYAEPGEVEVDVHYCGLNFCDIITRVGLLSGKTPPFVLGIECSGIIVGLGSEEASGDFKIGDRVVCYDFQGGLYRDRVVISQTKCFKLPDNISLKDASVFFVTYLTAYFSVLELGNLHPGETIFIKSCAGGVGWAATQLAHTIQDVIVLGTASAHKHAAVIENGVRQVFTNENANKKIKTLYPNGIDIIIENQAAGDFSECRSLLKSLGRVVVTGVNNVVNSSSKISFFQIITIWWRQQNIAINELMQGNRIVAGVHLGTLADEAPEKVEDAFRRICQMHVDKKIKPRIDTEWNFNDFVSAAKHMGNRANIGKIILSLNKH